MESVRVSFDGVTEKYPHMAAHINQCANIVLYPPFECAVVKMIEEKKVRLRERERACITML